VNRIFPLLAWGLLVLCVLFLSFPFALKFASSETQTKVNDQYFLYRESGKLSLHQDDSLAFSLWKFVANRVENPRPGELVADTGWANVLFRGIGSCDQQAFILISLARSYGLQGRMVFLYGSDSISRHSVAELKVNGRWCMFDPFYGTLLLDETGLPFGAAQLIAHPKNLEPVRRVVLPGHSIPDEQTYLRLFHNNYPSRIFLDNRLNYPASFWYPVLRFYSACLGKPFDRFWLRF
jgi:hypothetical protein